jgi:pSer/pThr/pTyr-binding forkhead associated (FHA) protein
MACLEILSGPEAGATTELETQMLIGRHSACDLVLPLGAVSRWHCRIVRDAEGYFVEDLGSLNGTFVNGEPARARRQLQDGDEILLYTVRLVFHVRALESRPEAGHLVSDSSAA